MLFFVVLILLITIAAMLFLSPLKKTYIFLGMLITFTLLICGIFTYIIKLSGFTVSQERQLFFFTDILLKVRQVPITLNQIAYAVIVGRTGFCYFLLRHAINKNWEARGFFRRHKYFEVLIALPIMLILVLFYPKTYNVIFAYKFALQNIVTVAVYAIIAIYLIASVVLMLLEYFDITLSWYKKQYRYIMFSTFVIILYYLVFAFIDPVNIFQDFKSIKTLSSLYFSGQHILNIWVGLSIVGLVAIVYACLQAILYLKYDYNRDKLELTIKKKEDGASLASTVLIHGIKNQILSAKMISAKICKISSKENISSEDLKVISTSASSLTEINQNILDRMTFLYNSFKNVKLTLKPLCVSELFDRVKQKVDKRFNSVKIGYEFNESSLIADKELLSEAIYNLVINAIEASTSNEFPEVTVKHLTTRVHNVIIVSDNGKGISDKDKNKVFIPFYTSKNTNTNWGLGLSFVRQIVKKHMGEIRFDSTQKGTTFYITLSKFMK